MTTTPGYTVDALLQRAKDVTVRSMEELHACQAAMHLSGIFDPAYVTGAQAAMKDMRDLIAELMQVTAQSVERASPAKDGGEQPIAWNMLGWARYDDGGFPHFCDVEDEGAFRVYAVNPAPEQPLASQMHPQSAVQGWQPIETAPVNKTVALLCAYRHMSDDLLGCGKDIGYLTDGGWFSTCGELRAMSRDAFTHWKEIPPDPQPPQGEGHE
jgi:hypothetical protein